MLFIAAQCSFLVACSQIVYVFICILCLAEGEESDQVVKVYMQSLTTACETGMLRLSLAVVPATKIASSERHGSLIFGQTKQGLPEWEQIYVQRRAES